MRIVGVLVALALMVGLGLWFVGGDSAPSGPEPVAEDPNRPMTEAEREAYVKEFVKVVDLAVGPDLDPDGNEVPGLDRISGKVTNTGDRPVDKVVVVVYPKDDQGQVLGVEQQDVIKRGLLEPGEVEAFHFQIRKRKAFAGRFDHEVM